MRYSFIDTYDGDDSTDYEYQDDEFGDDEVETDFDEQVNELAAAWRDMVQGSNKMTQWGVPQPEPDTDPEFWAEVKRLADASGEPDLDLLYSTARSGRNEGKRDLYYVLLLNAGISLGRVNASQYGTGGVTGSPDYLAISNMSHEDRMLYREAEAVAGRQGYRLDDLDLKDRMTVYQLAERNITGIY